MQRTALLTATMVLSGCGGVTIASDGGAPDSSIADSGGGGTPDAAPVGDSAVTCPPGTPTVPATAIYACEAGAPREGGCPAAPGDPGAASNPNIYPLGCVVSLPTPSSFCSDQCCGPLTCNCEPFPGATTPQFICPL